MLEIEPVVSVAFYVLGKTVNWGISTESGQVKKETVVSTVSTTDKFTIMYSNVDSLPNKKTKTGCFY